MTDVATLIRTLGAAGAPAEAIALAVEAIEAVAETQRAAARERKRRQRAREAAAGDVTGQAASASSPLMSPASPDPSTPLNPPTEHTQTARAAREKPRLRRGRLRKGRPKRLKREWQPEALPPDDHEMVAAWPPGMWERELARFRDHFTATGGTNARKHDWDAAWRNWLREADDERPRPRDPRGDPRARNGDDGAGEPASALVRAGLARLHHAGGA